VVVALVVVILALLELEAIALAVEASVMLLVSYTSADSADSSGSGNNTAAATTVAEFERKSISKCFIPWSVQQILRKMRPVNRMSYRGIGRANGNVTDNSGLNIHRFLST
jgi:hypothetical protein